MNSAAASAEKTASGIPWQPRSTASARHSCAPPPGASSSAHSIASVQVTAFAAGCSPLASAICSRRVANMLAVVPAVDAGARDRRAGLGQRERIAAQLLHEVHRAEPLVGVGAEPGREIGQGLVRAERPDGKDQRVPRGGAPRGRPRPSPARARPGPLGHSPSSSAGSVTPSRTTSHGCRVSASQARNRVAVVSASSAGTIPDRSRAARRYPESAESRDAAASHTSTPSGLSFRHVCARCTASCVFPVPPGQSRTWAVRAAGQPPAARAGPAGRRGQRQPLPGRETVQRAGPALRPRGKAVGQRGSRPGSDRGARGARALGLAAGPLPGAPGAPGAPGRIG